MASLHTASGIPVALNPGVFSTPTPNPLSHSVDGSPTLSRGVGGWPTRACEVGESPILRPANQNAAVAESLEITVLWGSTVLAARQLTPPRAYAVGEVGGPGGAGTSALGNVDFAVQAERLGSARRELVTLRNGAPFAIFQSAQSEHGPTDETPRVLEAGQAVDASSVIVDCSDVRPGARGIELRQDRVVIIEAAGISFRLAGAAKPERVPRAVLGNADRSALTAMGSAAILQSLLIATLAYLTPSMAEASDDELNRDQLQLMQQYLHANAERNREEEQQKVEAAGGEKGAPAEASRGPSGKSGRADAPQQLRRIAIVGDSAERVVARSELLKEAQNFGMIGMLATLNASNAPSSPWGAELALGPDATNAHGDLFSPDIGDAFGYGVGLSGTDQGGGGKGVGVGMGDIGGATCIGVACLGNGKPGSFPGSIGRLGGTHKVIAPSVRPGVTKISGRLPADVIQRIVRQNYGRFRNCYEMGLRSNPNLEGRVTARFVIGRDGAVSNVSAGGDLPDAQVTSCVASAFYGLSFPSPENGIVTVSYPIMLTPG